jgi:hypothetical protein
LSVTFLFTTLSYFLNILYLRKFSERFWSRSFVLAFISPMILDVSARVAAVLFFLLTGPLVTSDFPEETEEAPRVES